MYTTHARAQAWVTYGKPAYMCLRAYTWPYLESLMSRGPGRIERTIRELLDAHPELAFVTDDLVRHCYPGITTIERKHQVSVLRAAQHVIAHDRNWTARRSASAAGARIAQADRIKIRCYSGVTGGLLSPLRAPTQE
jgi:hypothetical protein